MKILFQGDSITDVGRSREKDSDLGRGYPALVAAKLGFENPLAYEFINRGVSGDRIVSVYSRIKRDIINLKPDYMTILIGVNDVWHELADGNGVSADKYEKIYSMLIEEIKAELPDITIVILEPWVLKASATAEKWDVFSSEVKLRASAAKRIAEKYSLSFIPLQNKFDDAEKLAPAEYWLSDGVHPTSFGHELIAEEWIKKFKELN